MRPRHLAPVALSILLLVAPAAATAGGTSVFAGAGPRYCAGETAALGALRASFGLESVLSLAVQVEGYLDGAEPTTALDFAGGQLLLVAALPVPGPLTPELGLGVGLLSLSPERHGTDEDLLVLNAELALRAALGPVALRLAWSLPVASRDEALAARAFEGQLLLSLGVSL